MFFAVEYGVIGHLAVFVPRRIKSDRIADENDAAAPGALDGHLFQTAMTVVSLTVNDRVKDRFL